MSMLAALCGGGGGVCLPGARHLSALRLNLVDPITVFLSGRPELPPDPHPVTKPRASEPQGPGTHADHKFSDGL